MPAPQVEPTYRDYLAHAELYRGSEGGSEPMSEDQWNEMDADGRWSAIGNRLGIAPGDERFDPLNEVVGDPNEPNRIIHITYGNDWEDDYRPDWIHDPNRILEGDGWYALSETNLTPDYGRAEETKRRRIRQGATAAAAMVIGGGLAYNAFAAPGISTEGTASIGVPAEGSVSGSIGTQAPAPVTELSTTAGSTASSVGTQVAAPVTELGVPASNSVINGARGAWDAATGWYSSLSAPSRLILGSAVSGGAQALAGAHAQNEAQEAADEREERERQDRVRRGSLPAFTNPYTPRQGIIGSRRTPGGG